MSAADVPDLQTAPRIHLLSGRLVSANYTSPRGRLGMSEEGHCANNAVGGMLVGHGVPGMRSLDPHTGVFTRATLRSKEVPALSTLFSRTGLSPQRRRIVSFCDGMISVTQYASGSLRERGLTGLTRRNRHAQYTLSCI